MVTLKDVKELIDHLVDKHGKDVLDVPIKTDYLTYAGEVHIELSNYLGHEYIELYVNH